MVARQIDQESDPEWFDPEGIPGVIGLNLEEGRAFFDRKARRTLGISGEEFLRRWDAGEWQPVPDDTEGRKIARISMLIPFAHVDDR